MITELSLIIYYGIAFFLNIVVLWQISKKQKLKRHDFKTAFLVLGISYVVGFIFYILYQLITFPIIIKVFISIFTFILALFLIKEFYKVKWWKAVKVYLLTILISFLIISAIFFIIFTLYFILKIMNFV